MPPSQAITQRIDVLKTLYAQAVEAGNQLAVDLKQSQSLHQQSLDKMQHLQTYAQQYRRQLQDLEAAGAAWSKVRDLRTFIAKVDEALVAQQAEIGRVEARRAEKTQAWTAARQREKAYELLLAQQQVFVKTAAQKQAQHELQEWGLNPQSQFVTTTQPTRF